MKILFFANTDWYLYNFRRSLFLSLRDSGYEVILTSPPGQYGPKLEELGFQWVPAPMDRRSLSPLKELTLVLWLSRLMREQGIDIMHNFTIKCVLLGSLAAKMATVSCCVNAVAGMGYIYSSGETKARILRPLVSTLLRFALSGEKTRLILQNPDDAKFFECENIVNASHIKLIRSSGVDCNRFSPSERNEASLVENRKFRVALAARLLWDKGIAEYVAASEQLRSDGREIEFILAGDPDPGNPDAVPESKLHDWSEAGLITWLGHVDAMPDLFSSIDVFVLPSFYGEGVPKSLIEAGSCGLALITTDMPGCREVVVNNVDGLLIPPRNSDALAKAIAALQDDELLRARLGAAAREKMLIEFDERIVIFRTAEVYSEILSI